MSQLAGRDIHSNPFSCGSLHEIVPTILIAFSQETPLPLNSRYVEMKKWRQAVSGLWTWMRPWATDHVEPWTAAPSGPRLYQGQRRRRAVPLRPLLCLRSLTGQVGVKRRHQSCTGKQQEILLVRYDFCHALLSLWLIL